ncbi:phage tail-collar fiber domain-containing protein [Yokenella regensburgei]|uniref:phage tail-collar fiber domain-containing protein n=1 Tax=Yokenella regensburgei TaxID=158877 RepID=UPI003EDB23BB
MSQAVITKAFVEWKAQQAADNQPVALDEFIFAFVPGLDVSAPIDNTEGVPPADQIVHRQAVSKTGVVNANSVVYSVTLGADVGDFEFNWIGLVNKATGTLAMIIHAPTQRKVKNASGQQGNVLVRSMLMEYSGAQAATNITTPAETWQIDFTARLAGMDEATRLAAFDVYGQGAFFENGFLVAKAGSQYFVTRGLGYVGGLRAALAADANITVSGLPTKVWADVCYQGTLTSAYRTDIKFTVAPDLADYQANGVAHYVFALASIDATGAITDLRPKGSLGEQQANGDFVRKDKNLADLKDKAEARRTLSLKSAALQDVTESNLDTTPGRVMRVGDYGNGIAVNIGDNVDLNNCVTPGTYVQTSIASAQTGKNYPFASAGSLMVLNATHGGVRQVFYVYVGSQMYTRSLYNGAWTDWKAILTADGGYFPAAFAFTRVETIPTEQNKSALFNQTTGDAGAIVSGAEFNWYNDKVTTGITRGDSDRAWGYAIRLNGNDLLTLDTAGYARFTGDVISSGGIMGLQGDERRHFVINNADGSTRLYIYKDKGGDGIRFTNGVDGGGTFIMGNGGQFTSPATIHAGAAILETNGDVYGSAWGTNWLSIWLNNQFAARDAGINDRATYDYVNNRTHWWTNGESGWWKDENTGFIHQWTVGPWVKADEGVYSVNFPMRFPNQCCTVNVGTHGQGEGINNDATAVVYGWNQDICRVQMNIPGDSSWWQPMRAIIFAIGM